MRSPETMAMKKDAVMEACFRCYCQNGLSGTGMKALGKACGMSAGNLYTYFGSLDDLIVESTAFCMMQVEDKLRAYPISTLKGLSRFLQRLPRVMSQEYGDEFRLMLQVYGHPRFREAARAYGKESNAKNQLYFQQLSRQLSVPEEELTKVMMLAQEIALKYVLYEDKAQLERQTELLMRSIDRLAQREKESK